MRRRATALVGLLAAVAALAAERPESGAQEQRAKDQVVEAIASKDCALAVRRLNSGLAEKLPGLFLLAGTMYEEGLCLKPSWDRAEHLYLRALDTGHTGGLYKLVSGYAQGGRDMAAALWWAQRKPGLQLPADCRVHEPAVDDPDAFVAVIRHWPSGRLPACAYTAGVLATIAGDVNYPADALGYGLTGRVEMNFRPAAGRIDWQTLEIEEVSLSGVVRGEVLSERSTARAQQSLKTYLQGAGERALKRYTQPSDIDSTWQIKALYVFKIQ